MSERRPTSTPPLLTASIVCFAVGVLAIVVMFAIKIAGGSPGLWLYLSAMFFLPVGFLLALIFALRSGRRSRKP